MSRRGPRLTLLSVVLLVASCTGTAPLTTGGSASVKPAPAGARSAAAARKGLCDVPNQTPPPGGRIEGGTPTQIADVEHEVEQVRGLDFSAPVPVEPLTASQMMARVRASFDKTYPADLYARRSRAWSTIGVIPPATNLRREIEKFLAGQVVGFYVPETGRLVFIGSSHLSPLSHLVLAHELTHALDDQHFRLDRLDSLVTRCADEREEAALGAIEGSAQFFSAQVAGRFLTAAEQQDLATESVQTPGPEVPPFVRRMELWPYEAGLRFIAALDSSGGIEAVNRALRDFPVSTEQVIHPETYPAEVPVSLDIADLGRFLGPRWKDLDVSDVGEAFLDIMLGLRLDQDRADEATSGWDGGIYRAWSDRTRAAVVMTTAWNTSDDAQRFAQTMRDWIDAGNQTAEVRPAEENRIDVLFASDASTLKTLAGIAQKT